MKINQNLSKLISAIGLILFAISIDSCKKLVESPIPTESVAETNVYSIDATAIAVLDGIYISMNNNSQPFQGRTSMSLHAGLSADEFSLDGTLSASTHNDYYSNNLRQSSTNISGSEHWVSLYNYVFRCNAAIEGLGKSNTLSAPVKNQLLGESMFLRAFYYYYLTNLYGDVPLALTTDPEINSTLGRSPKASVIEQIISDLIKAQQFLSDKYLSGTLLLTTAERVRPTKWAATALLARAYLFKGEYDKAETESSAVISNTSLFGPISSIPLNGVFLKNSKEAIWQLQPTAIDFNTLEAQVLVLSAPANGPSSFNPVYLSSNLLSSFEVNDQRAVDGNWINSVTVAGNSYRFPYKYKINSSPGVVSASGMSEYFMMLRLGEQYLIRAEARAQQNKISEAQTDLNTIRTRAGLLNTTAADKSSLLAAILHERQVELFSEWGNRWLDLKRTGNVNAVMSIVTPQKGNGASWQTYQALYPIPLTDIRRNPNLIQNVGY